MDLPKVSVIVPVYHVEKYLEECIDSLISQTLNEIEMIFVDDGSPDSCPRILDVYARKDQRIQVIHQKNAGVAAARNAGFARAAGEYVIFYDSDDIIPENACEVLYKKARQTDADVVWGDAYVMYVGSWVRQTDFREPFVSDDRRFINDLIRTIMAPIYNPLKPIHSGFGGGVQRGTSWYAAV
ncbi:MAG: glycosyltransferase [Clostridium sp.]|jgi:glycosyltransferase involved in cell wall biosynthesis|nr:glycosyltransferase [Clostridium sp.]